ncbi:MAG: hypothetical protein V9G19_01995 [Tetrasphaera sp.]
MTAKGYNRVRAARALTLADLVMSDAFVACFDAKYTYSRGAPWRARPGNVRLLSAAENPATNVTSSM